jgi:hypothetical protein
MKENRLPLKEAKKKFIKSSFYCGILAILACWFMKLFGFDYFGLDLDNKFFNDLDNFLSLHYLIKQIYCAVMLTIQLYWLTCIVQKEQGKNIWKHVIMFIPLTILVKVCTTIFSSKLGNLTVLVELLYTIIVVSKFKKNKILKSLFINIFIIIYQIISLNMRSLQLKTYTNGFMVTQILTIDFYLLLYLHKEMEVNIMGDSTWFFFGITAWLYFLAGFIIGIFKLHPIKTAKEWYAIGKEKENARKTKRELKKSKKQ